MRDDIVITGIGIVSPIGVNEAEFWHSLTHGTSGAAPIDCLDTSDLPRKIGCQVKGERWKAASPPSRSMGRAAQLAVAASRHAMDSAAIGRNDFQSIRDARVAVMIGTTMGETEFIENRLGVDSEKWLSPEHAKEILTGQPGSISQHVANSLTRTEGVPESLVRESFHTPAAAGIHSRAKQNSRAAIEVVDLYGACAAGNLALGAARRRLINNECDLVLAGGSDGFSRLAFLGFMRLRVMAAEVCRPFDQARDGLFVGEGAAVFVLERESTAKARGVRIRARILGAADAGENYHPTRPHPDGDGLSRAIAAALADADLSAGDIQYICAHGTGTPQNDAIEVGVMNKLFPEATPFSSIKALTGHTMGAAAAVEAAACVLALEHQTLLPTWHLDKVLEPCSLEAVKGGPRAGRLRCVINNSAGFGGYNSSVVIAAA
jgi:3-oxoacyl-[acyl-carrier-protein] synthase II